METQAAQMTPVDKNFRILVVDDDILILKYYQAIFRPPKYTVKIAGNGEEGLAAAHEFDPDLIISDVIMPKMDGYQFCAALRKEPKFKNTILLMSSSVLTEVKDAVKALKGGADDYILKPVDEEQVGAKVDAFLRIKVLQDDLMTSNQKLQKTVVKLEQHKQVITTQNENLQQEKELIKNSLKEKSFLLEELEESNTALTSLNERFITNFDHLVSILAKIIEFRRQHNKGHAIKVSQLAEKIALRMDLPESEIRNIKIAALLHEIGITSIPDDIMSKDTAERSINDQQVIEQYTITGERLLKTYAGLEDVALIIRHILEHLDGSGFPDNLKGESIPLGSRIIRAVKDFDELRYITGDETDVSEIITQIKALVDEKYDDQVVRFLAATITESDPTTQRNIDHVYLSDLKKGMILAEDLYTDSGILLIPEKTELTESIIGSIRRFNSTDSLDQRITINRQ